MPAKKGTIERLKIQRAEMFFGSDDEMLMHRFSAKQLLQMIAKQIGLASVGRERRDPELDLVRSAYVMSGKRFAFPVRAFKKCGVRGTKMTNAMAMTDAKSAFFIFGERQDTHLGSEDLVELVGTPLMHMCAVRVDNGSADMRFRLMFNRWAVKIRVEFNSSVLTIEQLHQIYEAAGWGVGIGDDRREKGGTMGAFRRIDKAEYEAIKKGSAAARERWFKDNADRLAIVDEEERSFRELLFTSPEAREAAEKEIKKKIKRSA